ncbi:HIT domain-containing protein [Actinopolymorpha sp. B11F2]|uniref:HIT family protein n=1 Tax=Actinopolymorpha sp. B11F2 TaxID=3160862 RepID=UPI0032E44406
MHRHEPNEYACPFCRLLRGEDTDISTPGGIVHQDEHIGVIVNPTSWNGRPGQLMVIPTRHVENLYALPDDLGARLLPAARRAAAALLAIDQCDGIAVRQHNEPAGGQDVWHLHIHVISCWHGEEFGAAGATRRITTLVEQHERAAALRPAYAAAT